jgi:hypothetical protein
VAHHGGVPDGFRHATLLCRHACVGLDGGGPLMVAVLKDRGDLLGQVDHGWLSCC